MRGRPSRHNIRIIQASAARRAGIDPKRNAVGVAARTAYFKTQQTNHASIDLMAQCHGRNGIYAALRYETLKASWIRKNPLCTPAEYREAINLFDLMAFGREDS